MSSKKAFNPERYLKKYKEPLKEFTKEECKNFNGVFDCKMCTNYFKCMTYRELDNFYATYFSLGNLNASNNRSSFENRIVLISLICKITEAAKKKNPDVTHYQIIMKLSDKLGLPEEFIKGLSIVCHDFSYNSTDFPTFGLKGQDVIKEAKAILSNYMPF